MIKDTTHEAGGCQDSKNAFSDCCQGMAEKMAACGPVMEQMMARCREKMRGETPCGEGRKPSQE
jgi:hypothetical protein